MFRHRIDVHEDDKSVYTQTLGLCFEFDFYTDVQGIKMGHLNQKLYRRMMSPS